MIWISFAIFKQRKSNLAIEITQFSAIYTGQSWMVTPPQRPIKSPGLEWDNQMPDQAADATGVICYTGKAERYSLFFDLVRIRQSRVTHEEDSELRIAANIQNLCLLTVICAVICFFFTVHQHQIRKPKQSAKYSINICAIYNQPNRVD